MALTLKQVTKKKNKIQKPPQTLINKEKTIHKPWSDESNPKKTQPSIKVDVSTPPSKNWFRKVKLYPKLSIPVPEFLHQKDR